MNLPVSHSQSERVVKVMLLLAVTGYVFSCRASAQPYYPYGGGLVAGYVYGFNVYDELIPIAWASITATVDSNVVEHTSSLGGGYFEMILPVGFYNLTVEEYGFISKTMEVFVSSGSSTILQFILEQGQRSYAYRVTVSITGFASDYYSNLKVDDGYDGIIPGGNSKTLTFRSGSTHRISVDQYVNGPNGIRYHSATSNHTVSDTGSISFSYEPQYYLHIEKRIVEFPSVEGWYEAGTPVETPTAPEYVNGTAGARYIFESWVADGAELSGNPISIMMDAPHNLSVRYQTQYYVNVSSDYGNPIGSGWYDANSTANVSVVTPQGFGIQKIFDHWEGDQTSSSPTTSIVVNSPKTLTAIWRDDYTQTYIVIACIAVALILIAIFVRPKRKDDTRSETKS